MRGGSGVGPGKNERNAGKKNCGAGEVGEFNPGGGGEKGKKSMPFTCQGGNSCCDSAPRLGRFLTWAPEMLGCERIGKGQAGHKSDGEDAK
jgi:hypothetical protein